MSYKKRRHKQPDPNQLMLFTDEEMSGHPSSVQHDADVSMEGTDVADMADELDGSDKADVAPEALVETPPPHQVMKSSDSVVDLLKKVMGILDQFDDNAVRLIAMQTAALVQRGIDNSLTYRLPAIPGYEFKGDVLTGLAYVSIARSFPNMTESIGLHWSEEYREAEAAYLNS